MGAGQEQAKFFKLVRDGFKIFGCGVGADKKFQPVQDSRLCCLKWSLSYISKDCVYRCENTDDFIHASSAESE